MNQVDGIIHLMLRTTLLLPEKLHQRITLRAKAENKKVAEVLRALLEKALETKEQAHLRHTYKALKKVQGICKENVTDASTTINQTLYGKDGAWKGQDD